MTARNRSFVAKLIENFPHMEKDLRKRDCEGHVML